MAYKFVIKECEDGYRFVLLPNNNNTQMVGESISYGSERECIKGLDHFRMLVKTKEIELYVEDRNDVYCPSIIVDKQKWFMLERGYPHRRSECDNWLQRIRNNIDAPLKKHL